MNDEIDITRSVEVVATCPECHSERLLPLDWQAILRESAPPDWDGVLRCRNGHEPVGMQTITRITCPVCRRTSYNPNDITERYCGYCHWWTSDPTLGPRMPHG